MKNLYLIRHTRPRVAPGICYGQLDVDLADSFPAEARTILRWLPPVELVLASPLLRTQRLGSYLAHERCCELRSDPRVQEKHFGTWEGKAWDNVPRNALDAWAADVMHYAPPGGESAQQLLQRVQSFLHDVAQLPQRNIAIVAHGGSIRATLALIADIPLANTLTWSMEYGAMICVRLS